MSANTTKDVLDAMAVPGLRMTYAIGCFEKRITIYSQQIRAFNLAYALTKEGIVKKDTDVAIIGGGISGITLAAALSHCKVTLYEKWPTLCDLQRGDNNRFVHPNIYDWPINEEVQEETTALPFMNWQADSSHRVIKQLDKEFKKFENRITIKTGVTVTKILEKNKHLTLELKGSPPEDRYYPPTDYKICIYAGGFGIEQQQFSKIENSYWRCEALHQHNLGADEGEKKKIAIIGTGDGGLIDCMRAYSTNFDQGEFIANVLGDNQLFNLGREMANIDNLAVSISDPDKLSKFLFERYDDIFINPGIVNDLHNARRTDIESVRLYGTTTYPLSLNTSLINRYFAFLLIRNNGIEYINKKVSKQDAKEIRDEGFTLIDRRGTNAAYLSFFKSSDTFKEVAQKKLILIKVGEIKYWEREPDRFSHLIPEQIETQIIVFFDKNLEFANNIVRSLAGPKRDLEKELSSSINIIERLIDSKKESEDKNIELMLSNIQQLKPGIVVLVSSVNEKIGKAILSKVNNFIFITGKDSLMLEYSNLKSLFPQKSIVGFAQQYEIDEIIEIISLAFPQKKVGFIYNKLYENDFKFFELLKSSLDNHPKFKNFFELTAVEVDDTDHTEHLKNYYVVTGRTFLHIYSSYFCRNFPVISSYQSDKGEGAIMTLENYPDEMAEKAFKYGVSKILKGKDPIQEVRYVKKPKNRIHPINAARFGISFNDDIKNISKIVN